MDYNTLADLTAVSHITIIVVVLIGLLLSFRYKRFRPWEAAILLSVVLLWSYYGNCPFTILEEHFRTLAGNPSGITNVGFLPYYANKLFSIELTSRMVQRVTFFTGGVFFAGSVEWLSPIMHMHLFHFRKSIRKMFKKRR